MSFLLKKAAKDRLRQIHDAAVTDVHHFTRQGEQADNKDGSFSMGRLEIHYVQRLPRQPDELPPGVVEIYIHVLTGSVDICVARYGFVASSSAVKAITERIQQLVETAVDDQRPVAERIGLAPMLSADWYQFLENLLRQAGSWAFFVRPTGMLTSC